MQRYTDRPLRSGTHAVAEALAAGAAERVLLQEELRTRPRLVAIANLAAERDVPVHYLSEEQLAALAGEERHQGAVAEVRPFRYRTLDELLAAAGDEPPFLVVLDGIEDPQNLGAILRTADAAGVHGVILPERRAVAVTPTVARTSAGGVDHLAIAQVVNIARTLDQLKERGFWIYGLDAEGTQAFDDIDYSGAVALVAGAEGKGMSHLVREKCDVLARIPMRGHVASLNVSVATSLALFAVRRSRDRASGPAELQS